VGTHEHDIAKHAKRNIVFKDGRIRGDFQVPTRSSAEEELKRLPVIEKD
jgi:ABC-type lipoprotein export system ATPase subunit